MDAAGLALLYTPNGSNYIPAPGPPTAVGRGAIAASFAAYFAGLLSSNETVVGRMIANGNMGAFSKSIATAAKATPAQTTLASVVNWFEFECSSAPPLIASFHAMFNASADVARA
jgi:hypothetical protein